MSPAAAAPDDSSTPLIFLIAGEPSGDGLGSKLMAGLKRLAPGRVRFAGIGGERMVGEGLTSLFPMEDLAVMGVAEVLPRLPLLMRRLDETVRAIESARPAAIVTIDAPAFCLRVARRIAKLKIPVIHYVAPQLWAWRPGRARKLSRTIDHLLVILPFEPEFFAPYGLASTYVGHPALEESAIKGDGSAFRLREGIPAEAPVVAVLPGSRAGEVRRLLPVFAAAVQVLAQRFPALQVVIPVVATTEPTVREAAAGWPVPVHIVRSPVEKQAAFAATQAAMTSSGTATLELALADVPMVVTYRVHPLTASLARRLLKVSHVALPNLVLGRLCVPELLQKECRPERIADEVGRLLADPAAAAAQHQGLAEVAARLSMDGEVPSTRAARVVLKAIGLSATERAA